MLETVSETRDQVIVVCTANVCRSPMAAALLRHAIDKEADLEGLSVVSAGIAAYPGDPPSTNSVHALKKVGIDLGHHLSRPLYQEDVRRAFAILTMTEAHLEAIRSGFRDLPPHLIRFLAFAPDGDEDVPDPFGLDLAEYENCRDRFVEGIPGLIRFLKSKWRKPS